MAQAARTLAAWAYLIHFNFLVYSCACEDRLHNKVGDSVRKKNYKKTYNCLFNNFCCFFNIVFFATSRHPKPASIDKQDDSNHS